MSITYYNDNFHICYITMNCVYSTLSDMTHSLSAASWFMFSFHRLFS